MTASAETTECPYADDLRKQQIRYSSSVCLSPSLIPNIGLLAADKTVEPARKLLLRKLSAYTRHLFLAAQLSIESTYV